MQRPFVVSLLVCAALFAHAQANLSVSLSGGIKIIDQDGRSAFYQDGAGYDMLTIKARNGAGTYGFSITDDNILSKLTYLKNADGATGTTNSFDIRDWNVWYRLWDGKVKVSAGILRNYDYRTTLPNWYVSTYGGTDLISAQGLLTQVYPVRGLSLGVFLPISAANQDFLTATIGGADVGASYSIPNVGIVKALVRFGQAYSLDINDDKDETDDGEAVTDAVMINAGFTFTAVDGLVASVLGRIMRSEEADATFYYAAAGADWSVTPKWAIRSEAGFACRPEFSGDREASILGAFWDVWTRVRYRITDRLYTHLSFRYAEDGDASVTGALGYTFGDGLSVSAHMGYDGDLLYNLYVYYELAF